MTMTELITLSLACLWGCVIATIIHLACVAKGFWGGGGINRWQGSGVDKYFFNYWYPVCGYHRKYIGYAF